MAEKKVISKNKEIDISSVVMQLRKCLSRPAKTVSKPLLIARRT